MNDWLNAWLPLEAEVTELSLTTSESSEIDLSSNRGDKLVLSCDAAIKVSASDGSAITNAKAVLPAGVYVFRIVNGRHRIQLRAISTANASYYIEKG